MASSETQDMAAVYAHKAALRKGMLRTLRAMTDTELNEQCAYWTSIVLTQFVGSH
jgi:hypothetical protein